MGVVNVTPDSFSDGGRWFDTERAVKHGLDLASRGADLIDVGGEGEAFLASDVSAFIDHTRTAMELGQDQVVEVHPDRAVVTGFDGSPADARTYRVDWDASAAEKDGYDSFMLKEIAEQPKAVADTLLGRLDPAALGEPARRLRERLLAWDRHMETGSVDAARYAAFRAEVVRLLAAHPALTGLTGTDGPARADGYPPVFRPWLFATARIAYALESLLTGGPVTEDERLALAAAARPAVGVQYVGPDHFATLGIARRRGRDFQVTDRVGAPLVAVINETASRKLWPGENPLGRRLALGENLFVDGKTAKTDVRT